MLYIQKKYKINHFKIIDDNFFADVKRAKEIAQGILDKKLKFTWDVECRADYFRDDCVNDSLLALMRKAGCRLVFVGVESGNQTILDNIHKKTSTSQIERYFDNTKKAHMDSLASVSFGFPGETKQTIVDTVNWIVDRLDPSLALFTLATPYPGTDFYQKMVQDGSFR